MSDWEALKYKIKVLADAHDEDGTEYVQLCEFMMPYDTFSFSNHRFFIVRHRLMDWEKDNYDHFHNDLKSALADLGKELKRKYTRGGKVYKVYGKPKYCDDWWSYRDELIPDDEPYTRSSSAGDYGPGNPWNAPGMSVSDFIRGVY